ncbi:hypothetical protein LJC44_05410 [Parabacteroides sp. OttesenSCG-928-G06]|nr:hypothetical protein [Parabacteroides sp. OttesenSCG-928-G06]
MKLCIYEDNFTILYFNNLTTHKVSMSDSAKGPSSGYLYQFEKALLLLSELESSNDYITIEDVDDIAAHKENGTVILTIQAKHSISNSGTTFEDTSYALWRTLQIWINKLENNTLNRNTEFICATNKSINNKSLLSKIKDDPIDKVYKAIEKILDVQKAKYAKLTQQSRKTSINKIITLIEIVLSKKSSFEVIKKNLKIHENKDIKIQFLNKIHQFGDETTDEQRERIWEEFYGWITNRSLFQWKNGDNAKFEKRQFDNKLKLILGSHSIINAIFRTKEKLGIQLSDSDFQRMRTETFVRQIEDIERRKDAKERIIQDAIIDFHYFEIELMHIITKGDYTEEDFDKFTEVCYKEWRKYFDRIVVKELTEYSDKEKNDLAIGVFDGIMNDIKVMFDDSFNFSTNNKYIQNGSFLRLSNEPRIGWHPEWGIKYDNKSGSK